MADLQFENPHNRLVQRGDITAEDGEWLVERGLARRVYVTTVPWNEIVVALDTKALEEKGDND